MPNNITYKGNCPRNVARDAKYSLKGEKIGLLYRTSSGEEWHATTDGHPDLVKMIKSVKPEGGAFYINEYKQVLVPLFSERDYCLAGEYNRFLKFEFEGNIISPEPISLDGQRLESGDQWEGPHSGIPYILAAGGKDIKYELEVRLNVTKTISLVKEVGIEKASDVIEIVRSCKDERGGRFYVNEALCIFAPINEGSGWQYKYAGQLDLSRWFTKSGS